VLRKQNLECLLTIQAVLHSTSNRDYFAFTAVALVMPAARVADLSLGVGGDGLIEAVNRVSLSCRLYNHSAEKE
jgi:hypothetical protein